MSPRFLRFVAAGGSSAVFNVLARILFSEVAPYGVAIVLAYGVGMTIAFVLNKLFVFEKSGRTHRDEYLRFGLVNLVGLVQVWLISEGLARLLFPAVGFTWRAETVAHVIGLASPMVTSYFAHKHFSFAARAAD